MQIHGKSNLFESPQVMKCQAVTKNTKPPILHISSPSPCSLDSVATLLQPTQAGLRLIASPELQRQWSWEHHLAPRLRSLCLHLWLHPGARRPGYQCTDTPPVVRIFFFFFLGGGGEVWGGGGWWSPQNFSKWPFPGKNTHNIRGKTT